MFDNNNNNTNNNNNNSSNSNENDNSIIIYLQKINRVLDKSNSASISTNSNSCPPCWNLYIPELLTFFFNEDEFCFTNSATTSPSNSICNSFSPLPRPPSSLEQQNQNTNIFYSPIESTSFVTSPITSTSSSTLSSSPSVCPMSTISLNPSPLLSPTKSLASTTPTTTKKTLLLNKSIWFKESILVDTILNQGFDCIFDILLSEKIVNSLSFIVNFSLDKQENIYGGFFNVVDSLVMKIDRLDFGYKIKVQSKEKGITFDKSTFSLQEGTIDFNDTHVFRIIYDPNGHLLMYINGDLAIDLELYLNNTLNPIYNNTNISPYINNTTEFIDIDNSNNNNNLLPENNEITELNCTYGISPEEDIYLYSYFGFSVNGSPNEELQLENIRLSLFDQEGKNLQMDEEDNDFDDHQNNNNNNENANNINSNNNISMDEDV